VYRTYFTNGRGDETMGGTWSYLDITALGRQEEWEDSPEGYPQTPPYEWWVWHDEPGRTNPEQVERARRAAAGGLTGGRCHAGLRGCSQAERPSTRARRHQGVSTKPRLKVTSSMLAVQPWTPSRSPRVWVTNS
jgi:hypothetical protein